MRPSSEGAPESTLEMERGSTHLPLLQSVVDFCLLLGFGFASPQAQILLTLRVSVRAFYILSAAQIIAWIATISLPAPHTTWKSPG